MTEVKAYFDGRFFVPKGPVFAKINQEVIINIPEQSQTDQLKSNSSKKTDVLSPPVLKTKGWKFNREDANER
jgi:hypothetical protein